MAGDGGRAPDVSEQRAGVAVLRWNKLSGWNCDRVPADWPRERTEVARLDDPASVLAALLAEQPDATIAALEALLTSERVVLLATVGQRQVDGYYDQEAVRAALVAACRSLRPKAPKEDRDA